MLHVAYLFDVDGVLTDEAAQLDDSLLDDLARVISPYSAAFITGRSRAWLMENLVPRLLQRDVGAHGNVVLGAEMGAFRSSTMGMDWIGDGDWFVPDECRSRVQALCEAPDFAPYLEWDATKEATATAEARHAPNDPIHTAQTRLSLAEFHKLVSNFASSFDCRAAMSSYALDVLRQGLTKQLGARFALRHLPRAEAVHVFGDSRGDVDMAVEAASWAPHVTFHWVGPGDAPGVPAGLRVRSGYGLHAAGTKRAMATSD